MSTTHLVIPDSHAKPGVPNDRYDWLGELIRDLRPDIIVNLGDHADMASLSAYDVGKKSFEGRRYINDCNAAKDSLNRIRRYGGVAYEKATKHLTLGNHEHRIDKAVDADPKLDGILKIEDLGYADAGWIVHPYYQPIVIDGISYCHSFPSGVMARPVGGEHAAHALLKTQFTSATAGHSHLFDYCRRTNSKGKKISGMFAGCYFSHNESFAGPANKLYSRGLVVKKNVKDGEYDFEWISLEALKKEYGK